jgi:putative nucleotidyltransferase with HDIG domain
MLLPPDIVASLVRTIELKDRSTAAHTWRVVLYARAMAEELGLGADEIERVSMAAALHDLGKIDIPDEILQKPGALTDEEFEVIKTHTTLGHDRLVRMGVDDEGVLALVRHHHERFDGRGYPDGISGEQIRLGPRIFAVIDTFDALTSRRPYRSEVGKAAAAKAIEIIGQGAGSHYHPEAADLFLRLYRSGQIDWILDYFNDDRALPGLPTDAAAPPIIRQARKVE